MNVHHQPQKFPEKEGKSLSHELETITLNYTLLASRMDTLEDVHAQQVKEVKRLIAGIDSVEKRLTKVLEKMGDQDE